MKNDWVYDCEGNKLQIGNQAIDNYYNSDKNGQQYMVAKLFGYVQMLTEQVNRNTIEIHQLKEKIKELEGEKQ